MSHQPRTAAERNIANAVKIYEAAFWHAKAEGMSEDDADAYATRRLYASRHANKGGRS
jgi:hypothetical protein